MTNQTEPKEPTKEPTGPRPEPEKKRPSREEQEEYFRKAAEQDIALRELFAKSAAVAVPAAALWG